MERIDADRMAAVVLEDVVVDVVEVVLLIDIEEKSLQTGAKLRASTTRVEAIVRERGRTEQERLEAERKIDVGNMLLICIFNSKRRIN